MSHSSAIPHFSFPFTVGAAHGGTVDMPYTVEQDSLDEIAQCVLVAALTPIGSRIEVPLYGTTEMLFQTHIPFDRIADEIASWEPRARILMHDRPDEFDEMMRRVQIRVSSGETRA